METKKISFGFSKITQKNNFIQPQPKEESKVELIKCLEGKEIKLVEEPKPKELLVIPMKESGKTSAALASLLKRRAVLNDEDEPDKSTESSDKNGAVVDGDVNNSENLEQRAARELLSEAKSQDDVVVDTKLVLPALTPDEVPLEGAKEPSFDDYESIPIEQFGKAMLRGMGWVDPPPDKEGTKVLEDPIPRPQGMGLGADKALKPKPLLVQPETNEVLEIKRKAFVRILAGKHKDMYGQIENFDDYAGRIIVKMAIGGSMEVFNEFMCQPVAKKEYEQYAKCINAAKYEAYKRLENEYGQIIIKKDELTNVEITKSDTYKNVKEINVKEEKYERYDRTRDTDRKYREDDKFRTKDSRAHSPSDQPSTSSQYCKKQSNSSSRDHKDSRAHTSRSRYKRKADSDSSETDSTDSDDSAFKRRHKKKSNKSSSRRKSKKSKSKRREFSSGTEEDSSDAEKRHKSHKKKTKKSKRERSRSRSRGRR